MTIYAANYKEPHSWSWNGLKRFLLRKIQSLSFTDALYFSAMIFFVSHPPTDWRPKDKLRYVVMLEDMIGWIFMTLFVVTLTHFMIRQ